MHLIHTFSDWLYCLFIYLTSRLPEVCVPSGLVCGPRASGGLGTAVLVLLVARLVPVEGECVPPAALLQLLLCVVPAVPALCPQLPSDQGSPPGHGLSPELTD